MLQCFESRKLRQWCENDCEKVSRNHRTTRMNGKFIELSSESSCSGMGKCGELWERNFPKARSGVVGILCNSVFVRSLERKSPPVEEKANNGRRMIDKRRAWESFLRKLSVKNLTRLQFVGYHRFVHTVGTRISLPRNQINFSSPKWEKGKVFQFLHCSSSSENAWEEKASGWILLKIYSILLSGRSLLVGSVHERKALAPVTLEVDVK